MIGWIAAAVTATALALYPADLVSIYDADTMTVEIDLPGTELRLENQDLRLFGINAYEVTLRGGTTPEEKRRGLECRDEVRRILGATAFVQLIRDGKDYRGKYGRLLSILWVPGWPMLFGEPASAPTAQIEGATHYSLNDALVSAGCAVRRTY